MFQASKTYTALNQYDTHKEVLLTDLAAIYQSIENILETTPGERLFNPTFGSMVENYLFEPMDEDTAIRIEIEIIKAIGRWDKRIKLNTSQTKVVADPTSHTYDIHIVFTINSIPNQVFEYDAKLKQRTSHG